MKYDSKTRTISFKLPRIKDLTIYSFLFILLSSSTPFYKVEEPLPELAVVMPVELVIPDRYLPKAPRIFHITKRSTQAERNYLRSYIEIAQKEQERTGIPASITLAQGILEGNSGLSSLARTHNNHFGIKCHKNKEHKKIKWLKFFGRHKCVRFKDDTPTCRFRTYANAEESYIDHSDFLKNSRRFGKLFDGNHSIKEICEGLEKKGYATSKVYSEDLQKLINRLNLTQYDEFYPYNSRDNNSTVQLSM